MRIRLGSKPAGLANSFLDAADKTYNQYLVLYWVDTVITTAMQMCGDSLMAGLPRIQRIGKRSSNPVAIEVADMQAYRCIIAAATEHIDSMPHGIRELFDNMSAPKATEA